jgi:23S rRNA pseudouridine1911/1915/1917 synthase
MTENFSFQAKMTNIRLDHFLTKQFPKKSRSKIQSAIRLGHIQVNGLVVKPSFILKETDKITGEFINELLPQDIIPEDIPLDIIYEDGHIVVVNKSSGLVVHPGSGNFTGTLVNGLVHHFRALSSIDSTRPGIVHRLDKETSGVILIAKTNDAHYHLSEQFANRTVKKTYKALTWGSVNKKGKVEGLIGRSTHNRQAFSMVENNGKASFTSYECDMNYPPLSWVTLKPRTGRTHQIRVHLKSIDHPIVGDALYGGGKNRIKSFHAKYNQLLNRIFKIVNRVALHAEMLEIKHPENGQEMIFKSPIPHDLRCALEILKSAH